MRFEMVRVYESAKFVARAGSHISKTAKCGPPSIEPCDSLSSRTPTKLCQTQPVLSRRNRPRQNIHRPHGTFLPPSLAAVAGNIDGQLQTAPDTQFVEGVAQVVLYHLFRSADGLRNFAVGLAFPDQGCDFHFFCG